jgi:hypothetical protein
VKNYLKQPSLERPFGSIGEDDTFDGLRNSGRVSVEIGNDV